MNEKLTWTEKRDAGFEGSLTTYTGELIKVADIGRGTTRNDMLPWKLRMDLPGFRAQRDCVSVGYAKITAERIVRRFANIIDLSVEQSQGNVDA